VASKTEWQNAFLCFDGNGGVYDGDDSRTGNMDDDKEVCGGDDR